MTMMTITSNEHVTLYYHDDTKIVHHIYSPSIGGDALTDSLNTGADLLKKHGAVKWLSDNRAMVSHSDDEIEWINNDWLPRAVKAGWKYWALVVPHSMSARMDVNKVFEPFHEAGIRIMVFSNVDEAMDWLVNIDQR